MTRDEGVWYGSLMLLRYKRWRAEQKVSSIYGEIERLRDLVRDSDDWETRQYVEIRIGQLLEDLGSTRAELAMLRAQANQRRKKRDHA